MKIIVSILALCLTLTLTACPSSRNSLDKAGVNQVDPTHLEYWRSMHGPK